MTKNKLDQQINDFLNDIEELEDAEQESLDLHVLHDETGLEFEEDYREAA